MVSGEVQGENVETLIRRHLSLGGGQDANQPIGVGIMNVLRGHRSMRLKGMENLSCHKEELG